MIIVLWGVSGCGKTTLGQLLAARLGCQFYDADDFHPSENIEKMRGGIPLTDTDRWPWLDRLADLLRRELARGGDAVLACSALKAVYRQRLRVDDDQVRFVQLSGDFELIARRLAARQHAFMNNDLLRSQFDTLEVANDGWVVDIGNTPDEVCDTIQRQLGLA